MYNLLISFVIGIAIALLIRLTGLPLLAAIPPGTIAFIAAFILLGRRIQTRVQALYAASDKELSQISNPREQKARVEKAVKVLEEGFAYDRWQFLIGAGLHGRIGMLKYIFLKDLDGALAHLLKAHPRDAMAMALQAAIYYQKKDYPKMEQCFELAVKVGKKVGLLWAAYAWCLSQLKEKAKALKVMARAVEANPSDEKLKAGLGALQNDKKLKMKAYEPEWWQFGLETPMQQMGGRRVQFERR